VYSISIGFGYVFFFGLGYFLGNRADREKLKDNEHLIQLLRVSASDLKESRDLYRLRAEELNKELEELKTVQKIDSSDIFRTPKGLLSFKKYVRE
jgi:hypothetical protein